MDNEPNRKLALYMVIPVNILKKTFSIFGVVVLKFPNTKYNKTLINAKAKTEKIIGFRGLIPFSIEYFIKFVKYIKQNVQLSMSKILVFNDTFSLFVKK